MYRATRTVFDLLACFGFSGGDDICKRTTDYDSLPVGVFHNRCLVKKDALIDFNMLAPCHGP